jgi:hypothetical protein
MFCARQSLVTDYKSQVLATKAQSHQRENPTPTPLNSCTENAPPFYRLVIWLASCSISYGGNSSPFRANQPFAQNDGLPFGAVESMATKAPSHKSENHLPTNFSPLTSYYLHSKPTYEAPTDYRSQITDYHSITHTDQ